MAMARKPTVYFVAKSRNYGKLLLSFSSLFPTISEFTVGMELTMQDKPTDDVWEIVFIFNDTHQLTLRRCEKMLTDPDDPTNAADLWSQLSFIIELMMNLDRPQNQQTSGLTPE